MVSLIRVNPGGAGRAPSAPLRRRLRAGERQQEIVATVLALARDRGPDAITAQAIADRMGVTQAAVFRHFPDKEAIWLAVFAWVGDALGAVFDAVAAKPGSPLARLERAFLAHVAFVAANPGVPRVLFHELQYPGDSPVRLAVRAMVAGYGKRIQALVRDARAAGEVARDVDLALAPVLFIGAVQGLVIHASLAGDQTPMTRRARRALRLLLDGYRGAADMREPCSARPSSQRAVRGRAGGPVRTAGRHPHSPLKGPRR